jgi:hypothetical protein
LRQFSLALAGLGVCVLLAGAGTSFARTEITHTTSRDQAALTWLAGQIHTYERATWTWQNLMGVPRSATTGESVAELGVPGAKIALARWKRLAARARRAASKPPHLAAFLCIHRFEGSWTDSGGPYYGGLQMDYGFQATYGNALLRTKGTADHWTPLEQIWVAEKALKSRGFWPWPNTARDCGLL